MRTTIVLTCALAVAPFVISGCEAPHRGRDLGIAGRQEIQREHIREGAREGDLTPREAARLRERSADIAEQRHEARDDDGRIDSRERRKIQHEQQKLGDDIYQQRHDDDER